jgi:hypothetical protein
MNTMTPNDQLIFDLKEKIALKKAHLSKSKKDLKINTNCIIILDNVSTNLRTLDLSQLVIALGKLNGIFNNIPKDLQDFATLGNYSLSDYINDIIILIDLKKYSTDLKALEDSEKALTDLLSSDIAISEKIKAITGNLKI